MTQQSFLTTERLTTAYFRAGKPDAPKLLLLHGNLSSSVFFLPLFPLLAQWFDVVAPDLRCFGDTEDLPIDATRGYRDWSDDLACFTDALGWDQFALAGWSMGGGVAMQYAIDHGQRLTGLILLAPGSPYGFGGTKGAEGTPLFPPGLASGGGCANPQLVWALSHHSRLLLRSALNHLYFQPPFRMKSQWEDRLIDSIARTRIGPDQYPGNYRLVPQWPFVAAGDRGILNAISPLYGDVSALAHIHHKPPILWIRGSNDLVVSDHSLLEFGELGEHGMIPRLPGELAVQPQPMVTQTRHVLDMYQKNAGSYQELVLPGGHAFFLESPQLFLPALCTFLLGEDR